MVLAAVLKKSDVTDVTVVEIDQDVIDLVGSAYAGDRRLAIVNADAFTYQPPKDQQYGMVWHDIWDGIRTANLEQMGATEEEYDFPAKTPRMRWATTTAFEERYDGLENAADARWAVRIMARFARY